jgi:Ca2+:H+ antiporter
VPPLLMFIFPAISIIPLSFYISEATESIAQRTGPKFGGFLNATFGNTAEIIISIFALRAGLVDLVKASIIGAVLGNTLMVLGTATLVGGLKFKTQRINKRAVEFSSTMFLFAALALILPTIIDMLKDNGRPDQFSEKLSIFLACGMMIVYLLGLVFSFFTHADMLSIGKEKNIIEEKWTLKTSLLILPLCTVFVAMESDFFVSSIENVSKSLPISRFFIGIILVPIIGNAAEYVSSILMSLKDKMDIAVEITIGSSLQAILFVMPVLVFISLIFYPMTIVFNIYELVALVISVLIANRVSQDGEFNWLEGAQLIIVFLVIAACFYVV